MFASKNKHEKIPQKSSSTSRRGSIQIEVLQNGYKIAEFYTENLRRRLVKISSSEGADLYLPNYKSQWDEDFLEIVPNGTLRILVTPGMEGFAKLSDEAFDLDPTSKTNRVLELKAEDNASIGVGDLHFLLKVTAQKKQKQNTVHSKNFTLRNYRGSFLVEMLKNKFQRNSWIAASMCTLFLGSIIHVGLKNRPDDRPTQISDLADRFTLPFIHPSHFKTAPEAMQFDLNRGDYIGSVITFYTTLASMLSGKEIMPKINENLMFSNSLQNWKERNLEILIQKEKVLEQNKNISVSSNTSKHRLFIATVLGESLKEKRENILLKIKLWQNFLENNIEEKRKFIQEFEKDQAYDFADHKSITQPINKEAKEKLSQIRVFNKLTDEEQMYFEAEQLAIKAKEHQSKIQENLSHSNDSNYKIVLAPELKSIAFHEKLFQNIRDEALDKIEAEAFGTTVNRTKKEPLVGSLDPKLVESVVMKNRFQLQLCFELALRRNESTEGGMEWSWRLDSKGSISDLSLISSNIEDPRMLECVKQSISSWTFPRPSNGSVVIRYPFQFSPARG